MASWQTGYLRPILTLLGLWPLKEGGAYSGKARVQGRRKLVSHDVVTMEGMKATVIQSLRSRCIPRT